VSLCSDNHTTELPHECPYQAEINDNTESYCTCCATCTQECSDDI